MFITIATAKKYYSKRYAIYNIYMSYKNGYVTISLSYICHIFYIEIYYIFSESLDISFILIISLLLYYYISLLL